MLSIRPYQRCTNSAVNSRMNPARQMISMPRASSACCNLASNPARSLPNGLLSMSSTAMPFSAAFCRPAASLRLEITTAISAGKSGWAAARINAAMFEPRPEIRMATRRFIGSLVSQRKIEGAVVDHALVACSGNDLAEPGDVFAIGGEHLDHGIDGLGLDDRNHADPAIEGAQQLALGNAALLCQPFEHRQDRQPRKVD